MSDKVVHNPLEQISSALGAETTITQQEQLERRMAAMEARLEVQGAPVEAAARSVFASLTEAPTNLHQATIFWLASDDPEDAAMRARAPMMFALCCAVVLLQTMTTVGVFVGTLFPACATSQQCASNQYCVTDRRVEGMDAAVTGRCRECAGGSPLEMELTAACVMSDNGWQTEVDEACKTYNFPGDPNFSGFNTTATLALCRDPRGNRLNVHWQQQEARLLDWCARRPSAAWRLCRICT